MSILNIPIGLKIDDQSVLIIAFIYGSLDHYFYTNSASAQPISCFMTMFIFYLFLYHLCWVVVCSGPLQEMEFVYLKPFVL